MLCFLKYYGVAVVFQVLSNGQVSVPSGTLHVTAVTGGAVVSGAVSISTSGTAGALSATTTQATANALVGKIAAGAFTQSILSLTNAGNPMLEVFGNGQVVLPQAGLKVSGSSGMKIAAGGMTVTTGGLTSTGGIQALGGAISVTSGQTPATAMDVFQSSAGPVITAPTIQARVLSGSTTATLLSLERSGTTLLAVRQHDVVRF
jgi:hypothetical protein